MSALRRFRLQMYKNPRTALWSFLYHNCIMEHILKDLIRSLTATSQRLKAEDGIQSLLHDPEQLPNVAIHQLANEALDLISDVRLLLEPGHLVLADHFFGNLPTRTSFSMRS